MAKRFLKSSVIIGLTSVLLLSACSNGAKKDESGALEGPAKKVEFWYALSGSNGDVVKKLVDEYNKSQKKIHVDAIYIPQNERMEKLSVAIAADNPPDLFTAGPPDLASLQGTHVIKSIDDLAKNNSQKITKSDFFPVLESVIVKDDTLWAAPISIGVTSMYYNENLFKAAGVSKAPETWDQLIETAQKLTDPSKGQYGILLPTKEVQYTAEIWFSFLGQAGGRVLTEDNKKAAFNSEAGVKALQLWVDLVQKYKVAPLTQLDSANITQTFGAGKTGMFIGYPQWIETTKDFPFTTKTSRLPKGVKYGTSLGGWYLVVPEKGKNTDGAYEFLTWLMQPANSVKWNVGMGNLPAQQKTLESKEYQDYTKQTPLLEPFNIAVKEDIQPFPATDKYGKLAISVAKAISSALYQKQTPKEALDAAAAEVDKMLNEK
ncbi:ABC transporter substrate-binding protein [Paenibacillus chitinolyticus]|uniref:ABC transporter substrate-binding protein n=1 Tax=Paenibacillus chitinolyticus TaxID=79263 RepID=UPI0026E4FCAE|nr:ABC transporter substrate-binding protein [Paenibacillus chitinolyticus]GKS15061.1 ABC transporter substrate-binding protein [Paenibacillus chitinolyticus]